MDYTQVEQLQITRDGLTQARVEAVLRRAFVRKLREYREWMALATAESAQPILGGA